ncbi:MULTISPECIES: carbohydrate ABC transporter permease [Thermus]|jgi:multiple sugar transport system permease protein|uniref:Sugar ABC transporter, permease protein n=1 Tax=Thermus brockianus TaxID=56956 RepID=A0A1J0LY13_THEBO|nr:carbohydrate ABC transporter permease [Thermus brockianus]APD10499.1 sugar ABC transporter, permease protein [Thermus brockianus]
MREERWLAWGAGGVLVLGLLGQLFPILWMVNTSLMTQLEAATGSLFPKAPQWGNYLEIWRALPFFQYLKNSLLVCTLTTLFALGVATLAGYALARFRFPGAELFGGSVLLTQVIPGILFLIPIYIMYIAFQNWAREALGLEVRLVGSYTGLVLTYTAFFVPISIWILRGFFASIPKELEEAALVDGATPFQAFYRVILPLALPGIAATAVYIFLTAWDELLFAQILTTEATATIPVGIRNFVGNFQNRYDLVMAAATVATLPVLLLFFLVQRWLIQGLTAGAVKG